MSLDPDANIIADHYAMLVLVEEAPRFLDRRLLLERLYDEARHRRDAVMARVVLEEVLLDGFAQERLAVSRGEVLRGH